MANENVISNEVSTNFDNVDTSLDTLNTKVTELNVNRNKYKSLYDFIVKPTDKTLNYSELDVEIPKLTAGTYNLIVDCTGVDANEFLAENPDPSTGVASSFGEKLKTAQADVYFNLKPINVESNVGYIESMFHNCDKLTSIDTRAFTKVTYAPYSFYGCKNLTSIEAAFINVTYAYCMFEGCSNLTSIDTSGLKNVTNANNMFCRCNSLTSIDTKAFTSVTHANSMFESCWSLTSIDTSGFTNVNYAVQMLCECTNLKNIIWGDSFRPSSCRDMFFYTKGAKTIYASADSKAWIEAHATDMRLTNYKIVLK